LEDNGAGPSEATVLGLDNVPLELPIAGAGSRALAAFLDYLLVGSIGVVWGIVCLVLAAAQRRGIWMYAVFLLGFFAIEYGYFVVVEITRSGQTFGKWALGLRVVTREAGRPGVPAFLIRNVVRNVDLVIGVPMMVMDPLARRLGDRLAGTLVVHVAVPARETILHNTPQGWGAREVAVLESFLTGAGDLETWRAEHLARRLLSQIERDDPAMAAKVDRSVDPVEALRRVVEAGEA